MNETGFENAETRTVRAEYSYDPTLDNIKTAACFFMALDHLWKIAPGIWPQWYPAPLGRVAWPLFVYVFATLHARTGVSTKTTVRRFFVLVMFGIATQPVYSAYFGTWKLNIMFSFALSLVFVFSAERLLRSYEGSESSSSAALGVCGTLLSAFFGVFVDYGATGVATTGAACLLFRRRRTNGAVFVAFVGTWLANFGVPWSLFVFAAFPFILFHMANRFVSIPEAWCDGTRKKRGGYRFHLFYFWHLYALYVVRRVVFELL